MSHLPIVSVVMPAFNVAQYVREAVDSVLAQRFDAFELLIADDGSTDGTREILDSYQAHPRVRLLHNERNSGAGVTRNRLMRAARGRYYTPCDADDIMLPGNLRRQSEFLDAHPEIGVVYGDLLSLKLGLDDELVEPPDICGADCNKTWDLYENAVNHGGSMSRRDILLDSGGYDENVYSVDDWSLWLRVAEMTRIHYLQGEMYYVWRRHVKSMTQTDDLYQKQMLKIVGEAARRRGFQ